MFYMHIHLHTTCVQCPWRTEEGGESCGTVVIDGFVLYYLSFCTSYSWWRTVPQKPWAQSSGKIILLLSMSAPLNSYKNRRPGWTERLIYLFILTLLRWKRTVLWGKRGQVAKWGQGGLTWVLLQTDFRVPSVAVIAFLWLGEGCD